MAPGGTIGWHAHPDVVFVTVTEDEVALYDATPSPTATAERGAVLYTLKDSELVPTRKRGNA